MPQNKKIKKEDAAVVETEVEAVEPAEELDPEVLEALNVKKKQKNKGHEVDYIPELERDEADLGLTD